MKRFWAIIVLVLALFALAGPEGVRTADNPPGVMFAALLNNVNLQSKLGYFRLGNQMQAVFLPADAEGYVMLKKADGTELYKYPFKLEAIQEPFTRFDFMQGTDMKTGKTNPNFTMKEPGNYVLEFYTGDAMFYKFPFGVSKVTSGDAFDGAALSVLEGAWSEWGYFFYSGGKPEQSLSWKFWMRHKGHGEKDMKIRIEVTRDKDKKLVCTSREGMTHSARAEWVRLEFDLINPMQGTSGGAYFKAKDLLAVDGGYTLNMKLDGKLYGTWKVNVAGGKFKTVGQSERGKADPLTFVEGGRDAFWFKKQ